jgi:hypothetical protein
MTIHPQARIAANIARMYPLIGRRVALMIAERHCIPVTLLTLARVLAEAERAHIRA